MSSKTKHIPLFYWSSMYFERKPQENYGDVLSRFIVEQVSGQTATFYNLPKKKKSIWGTSKYLMAIGSILNYATDKAHVWGSGIISKNDTFGKATFYAVRGPKTRERILELEGNCPEVYGDPALLLPKFFNPQVQKKYKLGIIPHYVDYDRVLEWYKDDNSIKVINLLNNSIQEVTKEIMLCEHTISSSLHGVIVSHAYAIPSVWVKFSDKLSGDNVKFEDYFSSVNMISYSGQYIDSKMSVEDLMSIVKSESHLPEKASVVKSQEDLLNSFPNIFK